jgi:V/A-type H+/Na+-transporting ATPase subunit K
MEELLNVYFLQSGIGLAVTGGILAVMLGGIGSARGIRIACVQGAGVMSEKPELFGKLLVLMALPGTQGFYGLIVAIMISLQTGLMAGKIAVAPLIGMALFFIGLCTGMVLWLSAVNQGQTSAASISLTAKKPEESGRAIILPALVETYAVVALLAAILLILWVTEPTATFAEPAIKMMTAPTTGPAGV